MSTPYAEVNSFWSQIYENSSWTTHTHTHTHKHCHSCGGKERRGKKCTRGHLMKIYVLAGHFAVVLSFFSFSFFSRIFWIWLIYGMVPQIVMVLLFLTVLKRDLLRLRKENMVGWNNKAQFFCHFGDLFLKSKIFLFIFRLSFDELKIYRYIFCEFFFFTQFLTPSFSFFSDEKF